MKPTLRTHSVHQLLSVTIASTWLLLQSAGPVPAAQIYNLTDDFSNTRNPNGAWSYNYNDSPISVFQTMFWGEAGWGIYNFGEACIIKGSAPSGPSPFGGDVPPPHDWVPGDVMMHAISLPYGGDTTFLNVRWTSPGDGLIDITGRAWDGEIASDRDVAWALIVGGQTFAQRSAVRGIFRTDTDAAFDSNLVGGNSLSSIPVTAGEIVEFRVMTDTYYGNFVGVQENITFVPEVKSVPLLVAGMAGVGLFRKFSPKHRRAAGAA
jgi:hypothetical protein